jgi:hypothetical protein
MEIALVASGFSSDALATGLAFTDGWPDLIPVYFSQGDDGNAEAIADAMATEDDVALIEEEIYNWEDLDNLIDHIYNETDDDFAIIIAPSFVIENYMWECQDRDVSLMMGEYINLVLD